MLPPTRTDPPLGRSSPETWASVVDLPHPVGPTMAQNSPGSTVRLTSVIAVNVSPFGVRYRLVSPSISMRAASSATFVPVRASVGLWSPICIRPLCLHCM